MMTCPSCRDGRCEDCVDRLLLLAQKDPICTCKKSDHEARMTGEPTRQQVQDPITGDVYGPALVVDTDGQVTRLTDTP